MSTFDPSLDVAPARAVRYAAAWAATLPDDELRRQYSARRGVESAVLRALEAELAYRARTARHQAAQEGALGALARIRAQVERGTPTAATEAETRRLERLAHDLEQVATTLEGEP